MNRQFRLYVSPAVFIAGLAGCASQGMPPPAITLDEPVQAQRPARPTCASRSGEAPALAAAGADESAAGHRDAAAGARSPPMRSCASKANDEARVAPSREGYVNAIQVWPFTDGALYQVYTSPGRHRHRAAGGRGTGDGLGGRHGALDHRRHHQRHGAGPARQRDGQAHTHGLEDQHGHHDQPAHLPARAVLDAAGLDGLGVLGLPARPHGGPAGRARRRSRRRWMRACRWRAFASVTRSAATVRRGSRCVLSTTGRRSTSSSRAASHRASCRRCS